MPPLSPPSSSVSNVTVWGAPDWLEMMITTGPAPNARGETRTRVGVDRRGHVDRRRRARLVAVLAASSLAAAGEQDQPTTSASGNRTRARMRIGATRAFIPSGCRRRPRGSCPQPTCSTHRSPARSSSPSTPRPTGSRSERCELTEVGAVLVGGGELHDRWSSLVGVSRAARPRHPALHRDHAGDGRRGAAARGGAAGARRRSCAAACSSRTRRGSTSACCGRRSSARGSSGRTRR